MEQKYRKYLFIVIALLAWLGVIIEVSLWGFSDNILKFWAIISTATIGIGASGVAGYILGIVNTQNSILNRMGVHLRARMEEIVKAPEEE